MVLSELLSNQCALKGSVKFSCNDNNALYFGLKSASCSLPGNRWLLDVFTRCTKSSSSLLWQLCERKACFLFAKTK